MKGSSRRKIIYGVFGTLALCSASAFLLFKDNFESKEFAVVINGKNEYQSTLNVELRNSEFTEEDFEYQWWYSESADSSDKVNIDGANSYEYKIEDGLVGKYIGVTVVKKDNSSEVYQDVTDKDENNTITVSPVTTTLTLEKSEGMYNGNVIISNYAESSSNADVVYTYYTDNKCTNKTGVDIGAISEGGAPVDAGRYYVQASVLESVNYKAAKSQCVEHVILPADVNVTWVNGEYIYNGQSQGPVATAVNDVTNEEIMVVSTTAVDGGTYTSDASCSSVIGGRGKCSNFNLVNNTEKFEIAKTEASVELVPVTSTYNGEPVFANSAVTNYEGEVNYTYYTDSACTIKTTVDDGTSIDGGAPIDAGKYYVQATYVENGNIKETKSNCVSHTIEPKIVSVDWKNNTFTYDGSSKGVLASAITNVGNEAIILNSNTATAVGVYEATASCNSVIGGRGKCSNYWLINKNNTFAINKASAKVTLESKTVTYNGEAVEANDVSTNSNGNVTYKYYTDKMCTNLVSLDTGALYEGGVPIDAGNYYVKAFVDESEQYSASESGCVSHIIKPIEVQATVVSNSEQYDGTVKKNNFSVEYDKLESEIVTFDTNGYIEPGIYAENAYCLNVAGGRGKCSNYKVNSNYENLKITQATGVIELEDFSKEYDNSFTQVVASTNSEASLYYKYYSDASCSKEIAEPISVGKYYVKAFVDSTSRYTEAKSKCSTYTIKKRTTNAMWSFNEMGYKYNGQLQGPSVKVQLADGLYYDYDSTKEVETGTYNSTIVDRVTDNSLFDLSNYNIENDVVGYSIVEASPSIVTDNTIYTVNYPNSSRINYSVYSDTGVDISGLKVNCYTSDASIATCSVDGNSIVINPISEGRTVITLVIEQSNNYNEAKMSFDVNVVVPNYSVNLYYNDGSGKVDQLTKVYEEDLTLPSINSIYGDYKFLGWSTSADGEVVYNEGDVLAEDDEISLYAVWKDMVLVNEDFEDLNIDSNINITGTFNVSDGSLNSKLASDLTVSSEIQFTAKDDSILSFNYGKYYNTGNINKLVIVLESNDGVATTLLTDESLESFEDVIQDIKLKNGTYTLKIVQTTDDSSNYVYIDDLSVGINDGDILYRESDEFSWSDFMMSINNMLNEAWYSFVDMIKNLFK